MKSKESSGKIEFGNPAIRIGLNAAQGKPMKSNKAKPPMESKSKKISMPGAPDALSERRNPTPGSKLKKLPKRRMA
jgi:hypothetical protein